MTKRRQDPRPTTSDDDVSRHRVVPGRPLVLVERDPSDQGPFANEDDVRPLHHDDHRRLEDLQARLYAEGRRSVLVVLQALDTGGKDGTIKHVFRGVNPQGCRVWSFKAPSVEEASHDFLWRYHQRVPGHGMIGIFNRSHYEDVLVVRVKSLVPEAVWRQRYELITEFERMLGRSGVTVVKFFLHISRAEQRRRLEARLHTPEKQWKFSSNDVKERAYWDDYQVAFEDAINATSTEAAPWYVVPSDHKWYRDFVVGRVVADTLAAMDPAYPPPERGLGRVKIPR